MFGWWTAARRRRLLSKAEPKELRQQLHDNIWQWPFLPDDMADRATNWVRVFLAEKNWEGCGGHSLRMAEQVVIAGQASLLCLAFSDWYFNGCKTLLVYPGDYVAEGVTHMVNGQIGIHGQQSRVGQTSYRGPVILNWEAVSDAGTDPNNGHSLTVHEMAHQIDFDNGPYSDGVPPLPAGVDAVTWQRTLNEQLEELRARAERGYEVLIDDYGLTSPSEFFAVGSELFFQLPHELAHFHGEIFELLLACYQHDWREWLPRVEGLEWRG